MENVVQLFKALIITLLYLGMYIVYGHAFMIIFKIKTKSIIKTIMTGFFVYHSLFQIVALPLKILLQPLSSLSILWVVITLIILGLLFIRRDKLEFAQLFEETIVSVKRNKRVFIILFAIVLVQFIVIMTNGNYGGLWDISYYLGETVSSIQSNTICQYDAYTGLKMRALDAGYLIENMEVHSAVICQITGLHPLVEFNVCSRAVIIFLSDLIMYKIALTLFDGNHMKALTMFGMGIVTIFCYVNAYSPASFFFNRTAEGKAVTGMVVLPMVFYIFIELLKKEQSKGLWKVLFITVLGASCINMTGMFLVPVMAFCMLVPGMVVRKKLSWIWHYALCMIPAIMCIVYYWLNSKGLLVVLIPQ